MSVEVMLTAKWTVPPTVTSGLSGRLLHSIVRPERNSLLLILNYAMEKASSHLRSQWARRFHHRRPTASNEGISRAR